MGWNYLTDLHHVCNLTVLQREVNDQRSKGALIISSRRQLRDEPILKNSVLDAIWRFFASRPSKNDDLR